MIYFILPIYNEENNIRKLIPELRDLMKTREYRIIAVNDGSSDGSIRALEEMRGEDLIVQGTPINMNIGAVFSSAIARALSESQNENDIIVIMESDQTSKSSYVVQLIEEIDKGNDVVIASRYQKGGQYKNFPLPRLIISWGASYFLRKLFPISKDVKDYTIFLRAYRIKVFHKLVEYFSLFGVIQSHGFIGNSELLIKISLFTDKIKEIPFVYDYGRRIGKSKMNVFRTMNEYFVFARYMKALIRKIERRKEHLIS